MTMKMATSTKNSQNSKTKNSQNKTKNAQSNKAKSDENKNSKPKIIPNQNVIKVKQQQPSKPKAKQGGGPQHSHSPSNLLRNVTIVLALLGIGISVFALYIEVMKENNPNYVAFCDVNSYISCSRVLTSNWDKSHLMTVRPTFYLGVPSSRWKKFELTFEYSKGFGLVELIFSKDNVLNQPNPVYGIVFYVLLALLALKSSTEIALAQALVCILANIGSIYLSYILAFVLGDACLICISTYAINFLLLVSSLIKLRQTSVVTTSKSSKKKKTK